MEDCFYLAQLALVNVRAAFLNLSPSSYWSEEGSNCAFIFAKETVRKSFNALV